MNFYHIQAFTKQLKSQNMIFNIAELNELIYALGVAKSKGMMTNQEIVEQLETRLRDQLDRQLNIIEKL